MIAHGTDAQKDRFLPQIVAVEELWCQGYSEPGAGSDLAGVRTRARLDGDEWVIDGQKVWTSNAHLSDWCFVVCRTDPGSSRHHGLSYLLVPMAQPGVDVRPIEQLTGTSEFNEVFFDGAVTSADMVVGEPGDGWKVAMATLGFERGVSTIGQQVGFARELETVEEAARANGAIDDPGIALATEPGPCRAGGAPAARAADPLCVRLRLLGPRGERLQAALGAVAPRAR